MAIFKCKMCGGALEINNNETVFDCEYCGTKQTLPKLDDERKANLYDRANHFRRNNEFDKATGIYEQILNEDKTDAESYWSLVLCRYGIEYVEDPATHKRVPTVNRAQFTSVFDDEDYKSALQYADGVQKTIYEDEAKAINEIQKGILAISQNEEPFDVFICYKETDNNGRRTQDSVIATELYHELNREGYKVFFSRITLEDKLGTAYEPYIFAALNSSKVMVVLGTKAEYFNAVWVKNEWSRYLALIKNGAKKILIPAYRDMDPYDLPEEFSHLQAQDMSKLGFMQDLIRGIKKLVKTETPLPAVVKETVVTGINANVESLLKRVFIFLEDNDWKSADEYCEKVLDIDPECAEAYLGKLMAELRVSSKNRLKNCAEPFDKKNNYQKILRYGDEELKNEITGYIDFINKRNENARLQSLYDRAKNTMNKASTEKEFRDAAQQFRAVAEYKDSAELIKECSEKAEIARKDAILDNAKKQMDYETIMSCESAISLLESISGWKNSDKLISDCKKKIEEITAQEEAKRIEKARLAEEKRIEEARLAEERRIAAERLAEEKRLADEKAKIEAAARAKKNKIIAGISFVILIVILAVVGVVSKVVIPNNKYNAAVELMDNGKYIEAYDALVALNSFKDSAEKAESIYTRYKTEMLKQSSVGDYITFGSYEQDNNETNGKDDIEWLILEKQKDRVLVISKCSLDIIPYNITKEDITWENCFLRQWLNEDFYNSAFTDKEKVMIAKETVSADKNKGYDTDPGNPTQDKVFIFSIAEAEKYFKDKDSRVCSTTEYAVSKVSGYISKSFAQWWLRTPGIYQYTTSFVNGDGGIVGSGENYVENTDGRIVSLDVDYAFGVRPAMWISLEG